VDDDSSLRPAPPSLKAALRRARIEDAERSEVLAELRGAEIARLEMLQSAITPVIQQAPEDVDIFDVGLTVGDRPRMFIDMIAYVEMGRDKRLYRFIQNTRHGPIVLSETESLDKTTDAVAGYVARRLIEREKALASNGLFGSAASAADARRPVQAAPSPFPGKLHKTALAVFDFVESTILILIVAAVVWFLWRFALAWKSGAF
jgi:hypothetical protein